jgi:carbonic anhydrase
VAPAAKGLHQSPVDIETASAVYDAKLATSPLVIHYLPGNSKKLVNNGHSVQVVVDGTGSELYGGPLPHKYRLEQFHFHWGRTSEHGAEHLINGRKHAAELHLVHWNTELYSSFAEAAKSSNGLAVLGVFLTVEGEEDNVALHKLLTLLPQVIHADDTAAIADGFDPASLLPKDLSKYWTYCGSLTTPPCYESVRFIIFKEPIKVSEKQMKCFRALRSYKKGGTADQADAHEGHIVDNFRPVLPLNDRKILSSF